MKIINTKFKDCKKIKGINFIDNRGHFREIFKAKILKKKPIFWCISKSKKNVLRGLHTQTKIQQELLVSVVKGKIFDVIVDLRPKSKSYGKHLVNILSEKNATSLFVPKGFAHGFCSLEQENIVLYGISNYRSKSNELGIIWKDNNLKIKWPVSNPIISNKDKKNITFNKYKTLYL